VSRWRKTFAFAIAFAILGAIFHSVGHGSASTTGLVLIGFVSAILAVPAAQLTFSARSIPVLFGALFGAQLVLHVVLAGVGHGEAGTAMAGNSVIPGLHMTAMHAIAALISTAILYFADSLSAAWSRFFASVIGARVYPIEPVASGKVIGFAEPVHRLRNCVNDSVYSRGPPLASVTH
jgi:hypothetical protein